MRFKERLLLFIRRHTKDAVSFFHMSLDKTIEASNWRTFFKMHGKKTKETIIIAIIPEKLGRGNSRWPLTLSNKHEFGFLRENKECIGNLVVEGWRGKV